MSIAVSVELLAGRGKEIIDATTIVKKANYLPNMKFQPKPDIINMRKADAEKRIIYLPFGYATKLGFHPNYGEHQRIPKYANLMQPREHQISILEESRINLNTYRNTTLCTYPGSGKTYIGVTLGLEFGKLILIVTPVKATIESWEKTLHMVNPTIKYWIYDAKKKPPKDFHVIISMIGGVEKMSEDLRKQIGFLIVDEAHMVCTEKRSRIFFMLQPHYVLIASATIRLPPEYEHLSETLKFLSKKGNKKEEDIVKGDPDLHGVLHLVSDNFVIREHTDPFYFHIVNTGIVGEERSGDNGLIISSLRISLSTNEERQDSIVAIIKNNMHKKHLILSWVEAGINELCDKIISEGIECSTYYGNAKSHTNTPVLIGTIQKMGTGYDEANFCSDFSSDPRKRNVLIVVGTILSESMVIQALGRARRAEKPHIIWFCDANNSSQKHTKSVCKLIKTMNGLIYTRNLDEMRQLKLE